MTTQWAVSAAADRIHLSADNRGELVFTVTNPGSQPDTAVFDVIPDDRKYRAWFSVAEPQRDIGGNQTASFLVRVAVPAGTPRGRHHMKGIAYSADTAPEESSRSSGRVAFEVHGPGRRRWPFVATALALLIAGAAGFWVLRGQQPVSSATPSRSPSRPSPTPSRAPQPSPPWPPAVVTVEAEQTVTLATLAGPGHPTVQAQSDCCQVRWSGHQQLLFHGHATGDSVTVTFTVPATGAYAMAAIRTRAPDFCVTAFFVDDVAVGEPFDGYGATVSVTGWEDVGPVRLSAGEHRLTLKIVGNTQLAAYNAGVDAVRFTQLQA